MDITADRNQMHTAATVLHHSLSRGDFDDDELFANFVARFHGDVQEAVITSMERDTVTATLTIHDSDIDAFDEVLAILESDMQAQSFGAFIDAALAAFDNAA